MTASFFPATGPEPAPEPEYSPPPSWLQPPQDEFPARVLVRELLVQTSGTALIVSHIDVYSVGIRIKVDWEARRQSDEATDWQATLHPHFGGRSGDADSMLRFGVALANGSVVTTIDRAIHRAFTEEPDGWSLVQQGGGGGGDSRRYSGSSGLWLWPLPPAGPIELVGEWAARGVPESRLVLDGTALLAKVGDVRPLWPEV